MDESNKRYISSLIFALSGVILIVLVARVDNFISMLLLVIGILLLGFGGCLQGSITK